MTKGSLGWKAKCSGRGKRKAEMGTAIDELKVKPKGGGE